MEKQNKNTKTTMTEGHRLQKFFLTYMDKAGDVKQYQEENLETKTDGLRAVQLPFHLNRFSPDDITIRLFHSESHSTSETDFEFIKYLFGEKTVKDEDKSFERKKRKDDILNSLPPDYFKFPKEEDKDFPTLSYTDITETLMFGEAPISQTNLCEPGIGIWGMSGFRIFEFTCPELAQKDYADLTRKVSLYWNRIDGTDISPLFETKIRLQKENRTFHAYINTNQLQKAIETNDIESVCPTFYGRFEIHDSFFSHKQVYAFPVKVCVHDTRIKNAGCRDSQLVDTGVVSIDFGTSATCAAVRGTDKPYLFTLSGRDKRDALEGDNAYENPTNLMIYNWDNIYQQWRSINPNPPFFKTRPQDVQSERGFEYDSGYTVEDAFADVDAEDGRRKMEAILTQLKSLPWLLAHGQEVKLTPYWNSQGSITVVDDLEDHGDQKFNPIALYGYLLSRAINNPSGGKIHTKYQITHPAKFDQETREKIRTALEYGILRALPAYVREGSYNNRALVSVTMDYAEPIACLGSIVGKQLKISSSDSKAKVFAIYDLGGGTMDFSFGIFRQARGDDELDYAEQTIEILGVGGDDKVGGEKLIHKLAYKIYCDNRALMEENRIKFVLPLTELRPEGFDGLLGRDEIAQMNLNIMKENLARPLFKAMDGVDGNLPQIFEGEGVHVVPDSSHYVLTLRDENGEDVPDLSLEVSGVDEFLEEEIKRTVAAFKEEMKLCFKAHKDALKKAEVKANKDDLTIFLSGNASKQHFVEQIIGEVFKAYHVERIGAGQNTDGESETYKVNEKTAVAFGQLYMGRYFIDDSAIKHTEALPPFLYNVGYKDSGSEDFHVILRKNDVERKWHKANRIDGTTNRTEIYYTSGAISEESGRRLISEDLGAFVTDARKRILYLRVYDEDTIEFRLGSRNEAPADEEEVNPEMMLHLQDVALGR
mgnify:CR=1 FL=1